MVTTILSDVVLSNMLDITGALLKLDMEDEWDFSCIFQVILLPF